MSKHEVIVVGCGGLGSAALYWLSRELGDSVLGIERFELGHTRGASQDHSRIIRLAQHQSQYAALAPHAYEAFYEIERESGVQVLLKTGGLVIEDPNGRDPEKVGTRNVDGYVAAFEEHGFDYELLDPDELMTRWPQFRLYGSERAIYQSESGLVDARKSNAVHVALARARGANIVENTPVRAVRPNGEGVEVVTDAEIYHADRVVVASDMWTNEVLRGTGVQIPLTITQEQVTYYATPYLREFAPGRFPVFMWHGADNFYGFPVYGEVATKLGQHMGGHEVTSKTRTFEPDPVRLERYRDFLVRHIPAFLGPEQYTRTCPYTIPPDQNFVLDTLPEHPQVSVAIGAGHAFKFASLIGRILSELALEGSSSYPIEPFRAHAPGHHRPYVREELSRVMAGSSTSASRQPGRRAAPIQPGTDRGQATVPKDRRTLGQTNTLLERGVDLERLRGDRLCNVQAEMQARDVGALLLTDPINIRYVTGVSVMPLWSATNLAHYVLVPVEGSPVVFEYARAKFRPEEFFSDVRNAHYWQARFAEGMAAERSVEWGAEIKDTLTGWGVADARLGVDSLDYHGFSALQGLGIRLTDADDPVEAARVIKTADEIELLKQSAAVSEAAMYDLEEAIRPGVSEHELLGVFYHKMLALGGEHCFSRLLSTGHKTNPWFHEAGSKLVRPGDLVAFDTDMMGPEGYVCDISRTFLCGEKATPAQKEAYGVALDFTQELAGRLRPGLSYAELAKDLPEYPDSYRDQRYSFVLHGVGTDDEPPFLPYPDDPGAVKLEGEFRENMVVSVEFYAGKVGGQDGVKLEDEVLVTADGPVMISLYPYEDKLL